MFSDHLVTTSFSDHPVHLQRLNLEVTTHLPGRLDVYLQALDDDGKFGHIPANCRMSFAAVCGVFFDDLRLQAIQLRDHLV